MGAIAKLTDITKQEGWNERLLYRAYDLILSWPLPETAVATDTYIEGVQHANNPG